MPCMYLSDFVIVNMYKPMYRIQFASKTFARIFESKILRQTKRNHFIKNGDQKSFKLIFHSTLIFKTLCFFSNSHYIF